MKVSLGRMPFKGSLVFVLAVTLLFPDVISMSIRIPVETTVAVTPTVASGSEEEVLEKEDPLDKYNLKSDELEIDSNEESLTELDSWDNVGTIIPGQEELDFPQDNRTGEYNKEQEASLWGFLNTPEASITKDENLKTTADEEEDSLALLSLLVKRALEDDDGANEPEALNEDEEESEPEAEAIDEDDFSFSDLPKIFESLIKAFSGSPGSEPPPPEDFFSWFPSLKELLDPTKEEPASVTSSPRNSITQPERRSGLPTPLEPALQMAPAFASAQPDESENLPSLSNFSIASIIPTFPTDSTPSNE
ncbi:uncharacterized protein LOC134492205 [Candoia aspera]|uniref:uncharacterized protein LOC134492205 n=1 Tax=Candoia aspera TaxID=51853 RepID=UPI002FD7C14F